MTPAVGPVARMSTLGIRVLLTTPPPPLYLFALPCSARGRSFRCIHISIDNFADHDARLTSAARRVYCQSHTHPP